MHLYSEKHGHVGRNNFNIFSSDNLRNFAPCKEIRVSKIHDEMPHPSLLPPSFMTAYKTSLLIDFFYEAKFLDAKVEDGAKGFMKDFIIEASNSACTSKFETKTGYEGLVFYAAKQLRTAYIKQNRKIQIFSRAEDDTQENGSAVNPNASIMPPISSVAALHFKSVFSYNTCYEIQFSGIEVQDIPKGLGKNGMNMRALELAGIIVSEAKTLAKKGMTFYLHNPKDYWTRMKGATQGSATVFEPKPDYIGRGFLVENSTSQREDKVDLLGEGNDRVAFTDQS